LLSRPEILQDDRFEIPVEVGTMREHEMRMRVLRFLRARMRNMLMPATVGLGMAVGGCSDPVPVYGTPPAQDAPNQIGEVAHEDTSTGNSDLADGASPGPDLVTADLRDGPASPRDGGSIDRDASLLADSSSLPGADGLPVDRPVYGVPLPDAPAADVGGVDATAAIDSSADFGPSIAKYVAPMPDAGPELPLAQPDYMAQMPDSGPVLRYMAQMPDAAPDLGSGILYMAPAQS
jgi:hypothetical protein